MTGWREVWQGGRIRPCFSSGGVFMLFHFPVRARTWARTSQAATATALLFCSSTWAQQVIDLSPARAPVAAQIQQALGDASSSSSLQLLNLAVDSRDTPTVNLNLQRADSVSSATQFVVVDELGERPLHVNTGTRFAGTVQGQPDAAAFVSISPDGAIRSIIHRDGQVIVSTYEPGTRTTASATVSRAMELGEAFAERSFTCGVDPSHTELFPASAPGAPSSRAPTSAHNTPLTQALISARRADIIVDTDYEFVQALGSASAAATYVADLFTYVSQKYQSEISTRFNLKKVLIRSSASDPWTKTSASAMLDEVQTYWNDSTSNPDRTLTRHHVHLLSGKPVSTSIAYVDSLGAQSWGYGVSAYIKGNFSAQNPQILWDTTVVAHEIGHAFGSSHTHDYDNPYVSPSPNSGGAIDCCYAQNSGSQCAIALGGINKTGYLPGLGTLTGGNQGQGTGTLMSYCHLITGGMPNISWSFGTNHPYGINPGRVPQVMTMQAQTYLPQDTVSQVALAVNKSGSGLITSTPGGINCGSTCTASYDQGTSVTLTATPSTGYSFTGWGGNCSGTGACTVTMDAPKTVMATFTAASTKKTLTVSKLGSGTVTRSGGMTCGTSVSTCSETLNTGTVVTLSAAGTQSSSFTGWSGGTCSGTGTCSFTLNADTTVFASFGTPGTCEARYFSTGEERVLGAYIAYYGRPADSGGLNYWAGRMEQQGGSIWAIIEPFGNSEEYLRRFGGLGTYDLVQNLYQQMYGRNPDPDGWSFYTYKLDSGESTLASIAINILDGTSGGDTAVLENRKKVARHFVTKMELKGSGAPVLSDVALANLLAGVTADNTSANSACQTLTTWIN